MFLSRLVLKRTPEVNPVRPILFPSERGARMAALHRLTWSVFSDSADRKSDFLWREGPESSVYTLSQRCPPEQHIFFDIESKPVGKVQQDETLLFTLRFNPTIDTQRPNLPYHREAIVTRRLRERREQSESLDRRSWDKTKRNAVHEWLAGRGVRDGYELAEDGFEFNEQEFVTVPRKEGEAPMTFDVVGVSGILTVRAPDAFMARWSAGFGRAKAFGCGMMMVRPL